MINVLLLEEKTLIRTALAEMIHRFGDYRIVGEASSPDEVLRVVRNRQVDVVVMEWRVGGMGGIELLQRLSRLRQSPRVIVCSSHLDEPYFSRLMGSGATAFVSRDVSPPEFEHALRLAARGVRHLSPDLASRLVLNSLEGRGEDNPFDQLAERELQVVTLMLDGEPLKNIAEQLNLSPKTVGTYRYRAWGKLGIRNEAELARLSLRYGMLQTETFAQNEFDRNNARPENRMSA